MGLDTQEIDGRGGRMIRRLIPVVGMLLLAGCTTREAPPVRKVVLISLDTLRPDLLTPYNPALETSPHLNRLAQDAVVFTDVLAQAPSTAASHKSLFYSVYPAIHKTRLRRVPSETLVSPIEAFGRAGFRTAGLVGGGQISAELGPLRGFDEYQDIKQLPRLESRALDWLTRHKDESFFLFLHTYRLHCPYAPPEPLRSKYAGWYRGDLDTLGHIKGSGQAGCGKSYYNHRPMAPEDYRYLRDLYSADIEYVDSTLGRIFSRLRDLGIYDETLIIVLSDHGEGFGEDGFVGHSRLFSVVLQVPLIIKIPGMSPARVDVPVELIDVMPTAFRLARIRPPYRFQGRDLLGVITQKGSLGEERIRISETARRTAVQQGPWRLVLRDGRPKRLVSLEDAHETGNVAREHPDTVASLAAHYESMLRESRDLSSHFTVEPGNQAQATQELEEQLRELGYVQ